MAEIMQMAFGSEDPKAKRERELRDVPVPQNGKELESMFLKVFGL